MKQLSFYKWNEDREPNHIKNWPNWTGEIPYLGDVVIMHFGDYNEEIVRCTVMHRYIDGTKPDWVGIVVKMLK